MIKLGFRLWVLIICLAIALLAISPSFESGVRVNFVEKNSTAFNQGLRQGMIIKSINGNPVKDIDSYTDTISEVSFSGENYTKVIIETKESEVILFTNKSPDITVGEIPNTDIKTGLDLSGGARALVKPANVSLSTSQINDLIAVTSKRFNVYGISDVNIRPVKDLEGNNYMMVEIAGATPEDLEELVGEQGKFEAKVGNDTVFVGGDKDITSICRSDASCATITRPKRTEGGYASRFRFAVYLSEEAAKRHAEITKGLETNLTGQGNYLNKKLDLYLDDQLVDSLLISEELKGRVTTQISVSGSGVGDTEEAAYNTASENMKKLQTVLITGSLPYKLEIVKLDTISPNLGQKFIRYLIFAGLAALVAVALIVILRYRSLKSSIALLFTSTSEVFIILGAAALINWNLDLASIAGILTVIGTGVDQQIILIDEARTGENIGMAGRIKRALFIIFGAYFTSLAALVPIYWAGAGLLKGFAVTTIIGISAGVFVTRPAFAELLKRIEK